MSTQVVAPVHRTGKPIVAAVFEIVFGSLFLLGTLGLLIAAAVVSPVGADIAFSLSALLVILAVVAAVFGGVMLAGGIFALQRRLWGLALAAAIVMVVVSTAFGIASVVLIAISRDEFTS